MSWLARLWNRHGAATQGDAKGEPVTVEPLMSGDRFVRIKACDFFGLHARSPNGRFIVAWADHDQQGSRGGHRESGHGRYLLIEDGRIVVEGRAERPNDGKVANNGVFILNDWRFGDGLKGRFLAFRPDGALLIERDFTANLFNNGLADDGSMAVCQTCHAGGPDNAVLAIFNLEAAEEIAAWQPESGWADHYGFHPGGDRIDLHYRDGRQAHYTLAGELLNRDEWQAGEIAAGHLWTLERIIKEERSGAACHPRDLVMQGLEAAAGPDRDPRSRARALRLRGELYESDGQPEEALRDFEEALKLDTAVGLKRKVAQMQKARQAPSIQHQFGDPQSPSLRSVRD